MSARVVQWIHDERSGGAGRIVVSSGDSRCVSEQAAILAVAEERQRHRRLHLGDPLRSMVDSGIKSVTIVDYDTDQSVSTIEITGFMIANADTQAPNESQT